MTSERNDPDAWRTARRAAAAEQEAALQRRKGREAQQARALLADFVRAAHERGLPPKPLRATAYDGRSTYKTNLTGWYLKRDRTLGVDTAGELYVLTVPARVRARWTGVQLTPTEPALQVGIGGRDGDSIALDALLTLRLEAGTDWGS